MGKPLVSFCVKCYNQRPYILAALHAAVSQTYRPLEIVVSDDCSDDGSFESITNFADRYRLLGGDIPIVIHRNDRNRGNLGNCLEFGHIARGELIVKADGDDISMPERTDKLVDAWLKCDKKPVLISSPVIPFRDDGVCGSLAGGARIGMNFGASQAYSRKLFDVFAKSETAQNSTAYAIDDMVFGWRARILCDIGAETVVSRPLVYWRFGDGVSTRCWHYRKNLLLGNLTAKATLQIARSDLETARHLIGEGKYARLLGCLELESRHAEGYCDLLGGRYFSQRISAFRKIPPGGLGQLMLNGIFVLPHFIGDSILNPYAWISRRMKFRSNRQSKKWSEKLVCLLRSLGVDATL